jgi:hypothetical protein
MKQKVIAQDHIYNFPPIDLESPNTKDNIDKFESWLKDVIGTQSSPHFYLHINTLFHWPVDGYFVAHGVRYCNEYEQTPALQNNPTMKKWLNRIGIGMQQVLADKILDSFNSGTLTELTEEELQAHALKESSRVYFENGFNEVVKKAPHLLPRVLWILRKEFDPTSPLFSKTMGQFGTLTWLMFKGMK